MKGLKIFTKITTTVLALASAAVFSLMAVADKNLSSNYYVVEGNQLELNCQVPITVEYDGVEESQISLVEKNAKSEYEVNFKLLGLFPISSAEVNIIDSMSVKLLGSPFGIKIYTDGVLVVDMTDVDTEKGNVNPAKLAGVEIGDTIKSINGQAVTSNEDVANIIETSDGRELTLDILRDNVHKKVTIKPELSVSSGTWRIGIWVRDSTAGIGTLTFYSPATEIVCGLGHGVCDSDTGEIMNISSGELVNAEIVSLIKGVAGSPGELKGKLGGRLLGNMVLNSESGVYAENVCEYDKSELISIAMKQEIFEGEAYIYTTVDGNEPECYSCDIKINSNHETELTQNLVVTITDERLLSKTGGIIQGMSGSPIVQNGKLIGAVTHVFVNNPKKGYGIFAENMLETARSVVTNVGDNASTSSQKQVS